MKLISINGWSIWEGATIDMIGEIAAGLEKAESLIELVHKGEKVIETLKEISGEAKSIFPDFFKDLPISSSEKSDQVDSVRDGVSNTEIKEDKPPNSPDITRWRENGGTIRIENIDGKVVWTYTDAYGREVSYVDGFPVFPPEAKHPYIGDIDIGKFSDSRNEDKQRYLEKLEQKYGLTEIPDGYELHHDSKNGNMQLIKSDWHKEFTHSGVFSRYKGEV